MFNNVELALLDVLDGLGEELKEKEAEVERYRERVFQAQAEVRNAKIRAQTAAYSLQSIERELDIVVDLYNRNRLELLALRLDQLARDHEWASSESEWTKKALQDRLQDLHHARTRLMGLQGEQKKMQAYWKKLYAVLRHKRDIQYNVSTHTPQREQPTTGSATPSPHHFSVLSPPIAPSQDA
jgi:DNA repair ATPase RecN